MVDSVAEIVAEGDVEDSEVHVAEVAEEASGEIHVEVQVGVAEEAVAEDEEVCNSCGPTPVSYYYVFTYYNKYVYLNKLNQSSRHSYIVRC